MDDDRLYLNTVTTFYLLKKVYNGRIAISITLSTVIVINWKKLNRSQKDPVQVKFSKQNKILFLNKFQRTRSVSRSDLLTINDKLRVGQPDLLSEEGSQQRQRQR